MAMLIYLATYRSRRKRISPHPPTKACEACSRAGRVASVP